MPAQQTDRNGVRKLKRLRLDQSGATVAEFALMATVAGAAILMAAIGLNGAIDQAVATETTHAAQIDGSQ